MTVKPEDIADMALFVAQAIHREAAPDEPWDDLTEEEQAQFRQIAFAAVGAHDGWLMVNGYHVTKVERAKAPAVMMPNRSLIRPN